MSVTSIVSKDPISAITRPKNGTERPTIKTEMTNAVLIRIEKIRVLVWFEGISSSRHNATGVMVKANFVNGFTTVVQTAILDAIKFWGMFSVNCDAVDAPNIMYPITATPAYNSVHIPKLVKRTAGNWLGFSMEV